MKINRKTEIQEFFENKIKKENKRKIVTLFLTVLFCAAIFICYYNFFPSQLSNMEVKQTLFLIISLVCVCAFLGWFMGSQRSNELDVRNSRPRTISGLKNYINELNEQLEIMESGGTNKRIREELGYKIITLCGSSKFKKEFTEWNLRLTMEGHIVMSVAAFGHADKIDWTNEEKEKLDLVHRRKIDYSDDIFVIDVDGYIGASTKYAIQYAKKNNKKVNYMSKHTEYKRNKEAK